MVALNSASARPAPVTFAVQSNGHRSRLTYQQLFAAGHRLWLARRYAGAAKVFERLAGVSDRGPRAHILLAHCQAMLGDYSGCSSTLSQALSTAQYGNAAADLHDIFVMWKCAFYQDVKQEFEKFVAARPELPTPCLIFAEFLMYVGDYQHPADLLRQAIERDRPDGAIAMIAKSELPVVLERSSRNAASMPANMNRVSRKNQGT